jgi:predicted RNase H-like HicB family nuclease
MTPKQVEATVLIHQEDGMYWAEVPSHPGLFASGETLDELLEALGEAWALYTHEDSPPSDARPSVASQSMQVLLPA